MSSARLAITLFWFTSLAQAAPTSLALTDTAPPGFNPGSGGGAGGGYQGPTGDAANPGAGGGGGGGGGYAGPGDTVGGGSNPGGVHNPPLSRGGRGAMGSLDLPEDWGTWWSFQQSRFLPPQRLRLEDDGSLGPAPNGKTSTATPIERRTARDWLEEALSDDSAAVRAAAATAVGRLGRTGTFDELVGLLGDGQLIVRERALIALGATGSEPATSILIRVAAGETPAENIKALSSRERAIAVLALAVARLRGASGRTDMVLAHRFRDVDEREIREALVLYQLAVGSRELEEWTSEAARESDRAANLALSQRSAKDDRALVEKALRGRRVEARRCASIAFGRTSDESSIRTLKSAFRLEREPMTRGWILLGLGRTRSPLARHFLADEMVHGKKTQRHWAAIALALNEAGATEQATMDALLACVESERNSELRGAYLVALGITRDPRVIATAKKALATEDAPRNRSAAALALAMSAGMDASAPLARALSEDPSPAVRATSAYALGGLGGTEYIERLAQLLASDADLNLARHAAIGLSKNGTRQALGALTTIARNAAIDADRRAFAIEAIGRLLDPHAREALPEIFSATSFSALPPWTADLFDVNV